jgi:hypothetical protein
MWGIRHSYKMFIGKPEEKRPLGRPRRRWEDNVKMDVRKRIYRRWTGLLLLRMRTGGEELLD